MNDSPIIREETFGDARLLLGDALAILPILGPVDHVIGDPPYEDELHEATGKINRIRNDGFTVPEEFGFDGISQLRLPLTKLCVEKSNGWLLLFSLAEGVMAWRDAIQLYGGKYDTCCFWVKPDASPRFNGQGPSRGAECIVTAWCGPGYRSWNGGGKRGVFTHLTNNKEREGTHSTEKPLTLMRELVSLFTQPGQLILDPVMGSGSTGLAAVDLGRRFVGIEQKPEYFDLACRRFEAQMRSPRLFCDTPIPRQERLF